MPSFQAAISSALPVRYNDVISKGGCNLILKNGIVFGEDAQFIKADIEISGSTIVQIAPCGSLDGERVLEADGRYIVPGYVDIHIHGARGADFCDFSAQAIATISQHLGQVGVTSFCGTTMAFDEETLTKIMLTAKECCGVKRGGAVLRGVNMEGPFFTPSKKGAQDDCYFSDPDIELFDRLYTRSGGNIRFVDLAPELAGSEQFIRFASTRCAVSIAHTTATYEQAKCAFDAGATHVTHLFNAMPAFHHRDPGVIGAAFDAAAYVEVISDGVHLHPAVVRSIFSWFGADRVCLISDAMRALGMANGDYTLGGQRVIVKNGTATLADGTLAGSATSLAECVRRAVSFGIALEDALRAATINPAKAAGLFDTVGSISAGKQADIIILDDALHPTDILIAGQRIL